MHRDKDTEDAVALGPAEAVLGALAAECRRAGMPAVLVPVVARVEAEIAPEEDVMIVRSEARVPLGAFDPDRWEPDLMRPALFVAAAERALSGEALAEYDQSLAAFEALRGEKGGR